MLNGMTEVPLAAQIEKVQRAVRYARADHAAMAERLWSAVLATLQQHEGAMAALRPFAEIADAYAATEGREGRKPHSDGHRVSVGLGECRAARAALDDASVTATPAGKGEQG